MSLTNIICKRVEFVLASEVLYSLTPDIIQLKDGKAFRTLNANDDITYSEELPDEGSGTISRKTLTVSSKSDPQNEVKQKPWEHYVLKIYTNNGWFLMGDVNYPATVNVNDNARVTTMEFRCESPYNPPI